MTVIVRDFLPADAEGWVRVRRAALPYMVTTPESVIFELASAHPDKRSRLLVAEADGELIGTAQVGIVHDSPEPGQGFCNTYTRPDRTGRGAGALLVRTAEEHLAREGARAVYTWVLDTPSNRAFAEKRGYAPSRPAHFLHLDLAGGPLPPRQELPPGVELRTAADFADDPRPLFELDAETTADEPSDTPAQLSDYEDWLNNIWRAPALDRELTSVALVDGEPAAFSAAQTDGLTRYMSGMTGTRRAYRGRGLAKLAKNDSLHRARAAGYTDAYTGNDADNGPMLAINRWFGYEICATEVRHVRELG
ncbi:GNAT family N-acetyltransferase [Streptomyces sp. NBC_00378]|uniref:GNAT family N-acetyltransferase n=1 Tax=unclassified Streptomyces TaxID=2593676 RepID=UPI00224F0617|nr:MULTISPECIES: GNAT family N-acetyltransferase [unclassified Streptomyces]MCX5113874.1 GNAT family N-acetyltransferase [Streptomyces sp. NBC_00378]